MQIFQKLGFRQLLSFWRNFKFSKILIFLSCVYKLFSTRVLSNQIKDLSTNQIADISNKRFLGIFTVWDILNFGKQSLAPYIVENLNENEIKRTARLIKRNF